MNRTNPQSSQSSPSSTPTEMNITCNNCQAVRTLEEMHRVRNIKEGVQEHGLYCPDCQEFIHGFFTTPKLEAIKADLTRLAEAYRAGKDRNIIRRLKRERRQFQIKRDKLQREVRKEMGMPEEGRVVWKQGLNTS